MKVLDVTIENYENRIEELELLLRAKDNRFGKDSNLSPAFGRSGMSQIAFESPSNDSNVSSVQTPDHDPAVTDLKLVQGTYDIAGSSGTSDAVIPLQIYLGSGSGELVCWNLQRTLLRHQDPSDGPFISPDFNSFIEESAYDSIFESSNEPNLQPLIDLDKKAIIAYLDNVVLFINSGYFTLDIDDFKERIGNYLSPNLACASGILKTTDGAYSKDRYFIIKVAIMCALGEIYGPANTMGDIATTGIGIALSYFKVAVHYLSPLLGVLNLSPVYLQSNLDLIECLGLASMFTRILDKKNLAVALSNTALSMCVSLNLHKAGPQSSSETRLFWRTFCLNRFFSCRIGRSALLTEGEITSQLPVLSIPPNIEISKEEYSKTHLMIHYIKLAHISDRISRQIYCLKPPFDNHTYLNAVWSIVHDLVDCVHSVPSYLTLHLPLDASAPNSRLIYTLHLNYIHHIYLACIPILLNLVRLNTKYETLPKNIKNLVSLSFQQAQLTINLFIALYKENLVRIFGFTDLDYLISLTIISIICLLLNVPPPKDGYTFEDYIQLLLELVAEMRTHGNLVAKGKFEQLLGLVSSSEAVLPKQSAEKLQTIAKVYYDNDRSFRDENAFASGFPLLRDFEVGRNYFANEPLLEMPFDPSVNDEDIAFMELIVNDFSSDNQFSFLLGNGFH